MPPERTIQDIEQTIRAANRAYWDNHAPIMSDIEYDALIETLRRRHPSSSLLEHIGGHATGSDRKVNPSSVLNTVGTSHQHSVAMLSLDKCYDDQTLSKWFDHFSGDAIAMPKYDGIAASLTYHLASGQLIVGATRGNGQVGENITANLSTIRSIPAHIEKSTYSSILELEDHSDAALCLEIRGEVYMTLKVFERYKDEFANPRNLTAGAIRLKDSEKSKQYDLSFVAYNLLIHNAETKVNYTLAIETEEEKLKLIDSIGFQTPTYLRVDGQLMHRAFIDFAEHLDDLNFEADGYVYKANSLSEQKRLGATAHHPRYAIAYKLQGDSSSSHVVDIVWQVSRAGTLTPVAVIDPTVLSGAEISRVTLHHAGMIAQLDIAIGDEVLVTRRGGVIPKIEGVISQVSSARQQASLPASCPSCSSPTVHSGDFLYCQLGKNCPAALQQYLVFFSKALDMQGFGPRVVASCIEAKLLHRPIDFFRLSIEQLAALDRLGEKSATNLIAEVDKVRTVDFSVFLYALGLPDVGKQLARLLASRYETLDALRAATSDQLAELPGVADIVAAKVIDGIRAQAQDIADLLTVLVIRPGRSIANRRSENRDDLDYDKTHVFYDKSVVFTGKLISISRKQAQHRIQDYGGKTPTQIGAKTDYLVIGAGGGGGSKRSKAEKLDVQILSEDEFIDLIEQ